MDSRDFLPWHVVVFAVLLLALFGAGPFFLGSNVLAQLFFNVIMAIATTVVSIYATRHYAANQARAELIRYGLQAWRALNSLQVKVSQHLTSEKIPTTTLHAWIMDIDGAKWAWQDLLREVFTLQDRLQVETDEVVERYKSAIASTGSAEERSNLETKQAAELAMLAAKAPLPIKLPEEVACPKCATKMTARVGAAPGDSGWPICPNCKTRFPVFRKADGSVQLSDRQSTGTVTNPCPKCQTPISFVLYEEGEVSFLATCPDCHTHIQFVGSPEKQKLEDLDVENAEFECPHCGSSTKCWIAPGRKVSFATECTTCHKYVRVTGNRENFRVKADT